MDGTWPTMVPGDPVGSFERYRALVGWRRAVADTVFWDRALGSTLATVFSGISTELKETANSIVCTAKYVITTTNQSSMNYSATLYRPTGG